MSEYEGMKAIHRLFFKAENPPDIRPMINRLRRYPTFQGMAVHDVETRPYVVDDDGRMWMLDGSGEVA